MQARGLWKQLAGSSSHRKPMKAPGLQSRAQGQVNRPVCDQRRPGMNFNMVRARATLEEARLNARTRLADRHLRENEWQHCRAASTSSGQHRGVIFELGNSLLSASIPFLFSLLLVLRFEKIGAAAETLLHLLVLVPAIMTGFHLFSTAGVPFTAPCRGCLARNGPLRAG
jgi:hypothetical protein